MGNPTQTQEKPQTLEERLVEKSIKTMEKQVSDRTTEQLQNGQKPQQILQNLLQSVSGEQITQQDILGQINQLGSQKVPKAGTITGILPALFQAIKGQGFKPFAPQQEALGMTEAIDILQLQNQMQQQAGQVPKTQTELLKNLIDIAKTTGNEELYKAAGGQISPDIDWRTGQLTPEAKAKERALGERAVEVEKMNIKKEELAQELDNYFEIGDLLPTAEGVERFQKGFTLFGKGVLQSDVIGAAAADLDKLNKKLRVKLVRAAGDVGNLNIVEQKAAEELLFNLSDSTPLRAIKKAFLTDMKRAIDDKNPSQVKLLIKEWVSNPEFQAKYPEIYKKYQKRNYLKEEQPSNQIGWTNEKESRYQELLKKRGK